MITALGLVVFLLVAWLLRILRRENEKQRQRIRQEMRGHVITDEYLLELRVGQRMSRHPHDAP